MPFTFIEIKIPGIKAHEIRSFQVLPINKFRQSKIKKPMNTALREFIGLSVMRTYFPLK
jgi:hypothetical protein